MPISDTATDTGSDSDSGSGSESGSDSESDSDGTISDMLVQPPCPAVLGEVISCDCAVVEDCAIPDALWPIACEVGCEDLPEPCPTVSCSFDTSTSWPGCETELDVDALQCVFDALAEGQPMQWETQRFGKSFWYRPPGFFESSRRFLRLAETTYVVHRIENADQAHEMFPGEDAASFAGLDIADEGWMECDAAPTDYERFACLHALSGAACADPSALICP